MPKDWTQYLASAFVGAVIFVVLGYIGYAASSDAGGAFNFAYWLTSRPVERGAVYWIGTGLLVGIAARYAAKRT